MIEISNTWEEKEEPVDRHTAGDVRCNVEIYKSFQQGLKALSEEIKRYSDNLIRRFNLSISGWAEL